MHDPLSRRQFLGTGLATTALGALAAPARAVEAFVHAGPPRLRLALAAYSFRDDFKPAKEGSPARMDMFSFLDYCAEHRCDGAELTSYYFPDAVTDDYLLRVRRHAHLRGITISGTAVGNDFCHPAGPKRDQEIAGVKQWIQRAALLGAPHIRVFAGGAHGQDIAVAKRQCIEALEECAEPAGRAGIFLGIENHGGIVAESADLLEIVRAVRSPWVGINLDTGNFHTDDPYVDLALCAPFAVNVQFKGKIRRRNQKEVETADFARTFQILRDARYQGWVALEYELAEDPWTRVPEMLDAMRPHLKS
ncbi:MAG: sugar phosphate isomerase/epimerase [Verrucomicrobiales bacterium]|nr:sugar phosphate isomerase/epimerase [Verrucomicrobiales bacterium]